ncbi:MAG: glycosyltransferase family 9 protein, partial [Chloroflexi bacterium]|nr:glycosyltransferase family 9 protein [Chloroflexota bacterium]
MQINNHLEAGKSGNPLPLRKILVVKLADIGDVLTAGPALRALRETYPAAQIDVLVTPGSSPVLKDLPLVDNLILFDKFRFDSVGTLLNLSKIYKAGRFLGDLRAARYDAVVILHHLTTFWGASKYALLAISTGAKYRAGLDNGRGWFLTHRTPDLGFGAYHEAEYCLQTVATIGAKTNDVRATLSIAQEDDDFASSALAGFINDGDETPLVAIHPGSGPYCLARRWPVERFAEVADGLANLGAKIVLLGGPDEVVLVDRLDRLSQETKLNLAGKTTTNQLAA